MEPPICALYCIQSCATAAPYLAWVEPFLTTDRTSPELLATAGLEKEGCSLGFAPGTELEKALAELPAGMDAGDNMVWEDGSLSLGVLAGAPELVALLETSESLLAIHPAGGAAELSDDDASRFDDPAGWHCVSVAMHDLGERDRAVAVLHAAFG